MSADAISSLGLSTNSSSSAGVAYSTGSSDGNKQIGSSIFNIGEIFTKKDREDIPPCFATLAPYAHALQGQGCTIHQ